VTDLSELVVRIRADASALEREMKRASGVVTREVSSMDKVFGAFKTQMLALVPALSVAAVVNFAKNASLAADRLNDLSARTGIAATTLSALSLPLKQGGSDIEQFSASITRMNNAIGEAASNGEAGKVFTDIGLSVGDLLSMSPEEQFNAIAQALASIENQAEFTNKGMAIFGRSFAAIAPIIRETNGEMAAFVKRQQELGLAFSESDLKMVNDFWDAMEGRITQAEVAIVRFINNLINLRSNMQEIESDTSIYHAARKSGMTHDQAAALKQRVSLTRPSEPSEITFKKPAALPPGKQSDLSKYNQDLKRSVELAALDERAQISLTTRYKTLDAAKGDGVKASEAMIAANQNLALQAYDAKEALDAQTRAQEKAKRESERFAQVLSDKLSGSLTDAVFGAENAGDAIRGMMDNIARAIFEKSIAQPFSDGIVNAVSGSGIFNSIGGFFGNMIPSFDVGSYNIPQDTMAMVHKGEMIIPANQAEQIRQGSNGGVTVVQNLHFNDSVRGAARDEIMRAAPAIAAAAKDAVFNDIQRGGSAAKLVGVR
jgi:hypothetical protein